MIVAIGVARARAQGHAIIITEIAIIIAPSAPLSLSTYQPIKHKSAIAKIVREKFCEILLARFCIDGLWARLCSTRLRSLLIRLSLKLLVAL